MNLLSSVFSVPSFHFSHRSSLIHPSLLLCTAFLLPVTAHGELPEVGKPAPTISIAEWVTGAIEGERPFAGKTVILEFWATWCSPCVKAIPDMNNLQSQFRDILFVSITDERRAVVERFLTKTTMNSAVVIDDARKTYAAYGVDAIPQAFLIDTAGVVRWHGDPRELTTQSLQLYLEAGIAPDTIEF